MLLSVLLSVQTAITTCTMRFCLIFPASTLFFSVYFVCAVEISLDEYLDLQQDKINQYLNKLIINEDNDDGKRVIFENVYNFSLQVNSTKAHTFSIFNQLYLIAGDKLYKVEISPRMVQLIPEKNTKILRHGNITSIKAVEHQNEALVILTFSKKISDVYKFETRSKTWIFVQQIVVPSQFSIEDVDFFKNQNHLYIILLNGIENNFSPSLLYKWTRTYFDEIDTIPTQNALNCVTFPAKKSQIIVVVQNSSSEKSNGIVFKFHNNRVKKVQFLNEVDEPKQALQFKYQNEQYIVVFGNNNVLFYWWDGDELLLWKNLQVETKPKLLAHIQDNSVLFTRFTDHIALYLLTPSGITMLSKIKQNQSQRTITIDYLRYELNDLIFLFSFDKENINVEAVNIKLNIETDENKKHAQDDLMQCLVTLDKSLPGKPEKTQLFHEVKDEIVEAESFFGAQQSLSQQINITQLKIYIENVEHSIKKLQTQLKNRSTPVVFNKKVILKGDLFAFELSGENVNVKLVNDHEWDSNKWMTYNTDQNVSGLYTIKYFKGVDFSGLDFLKDAFFSKGNQTITGKFSVNTLQSDHIITETINDIVVKDIVKCGQFRKIKGSKTFTNLHCDYLQFLRMNSKNHSVILEDLEKSANELFIDNNLILVNIEFENVNGLDWIDFKRNLFLLEKAQFIEGNLEMSSLKANDTEAEFIKGKNSSTLFTVDSDQQITTQIEFRNVHAKNVCLETLNEIRLEKDVASIKNNNIKGPVKMDHLTVLDTLKTSFNPSERQAKKFEDTLQIYEKKLTITGNAIFTNMVLAEKAEILVDNNKIATPIEESYWLKSQDQEIPHNVTFEKGFETTTLSVNNLNYVNLKDYLFIDRNNELPVTLVFENVTVAGNVILDGSFKHNPDLNRLALHAVTKNTRHKINGTKSFKSKLTVNNVICHKINNVRASEFLTKSSKIILDKKKFESIIIKNNLRVNNLTTSFLNKIDLDFVRNSTIFIDQNYSPEALHFENLTVKNLFTIKLPELIDRIYVFGHAYGKNLLNVSTINDLDVTKLFKNISVSKNGKHVVQGDVTFSGDVLTENIEVVNVNNINFELLTSRLFYRFWSQEIPVKFHFGKFFTKNLVAPQVNSIKLDDLINKNTSEVQSIKLERPWKIQSARFGKSVQSEKFVCDLGKAFIYNQNPNISEWSKIHIKKNVSLFHEESELKYLINNCVTKYANHTILGQVRFNNHVTCKIATTKKTINDIDLRSLLSDVVYQQAEEQVIIGKNKFETIFASIVLLNKSTIIQTINKRHFSFVMENIITEGDLKGRVIKGQKTFFNGMQANQLWSSSISNLNPDNLVELHHLKPIPRAYFNSISITNNFNVDIINDLNFSQIFNNRLLISSDQEQILRGNYYFSNLFLIGPSNVSKINDVEMKKVVLNKGFQNITGAKYFSKNITAQGNIHCTKIEGYDLSEVFENSIKKEEKNNINANMWFFTTSWLHGNVTMVYINDHGMDDMMQLFNKNQSQFYFDLSNNIENIKNVLYDNEKIIHVAGKQFLYLEKSHEIQLFVPNARNVEITGTNKEILLSIFSTVNGSACGIPPRCECPIQQIYQINSFNSITKYPELISERVYTYQDDHIVIHLITNSIKNDDENCRSPRNDTQPLTTLTWTLKNQSKSKSTFIHNKFITGYISDVQYFRHQRFSYVLIGRSYSLRSKENDLTCLVFKIWPEKGKAEKIQEIQTKGVKKLIVFPASHGIFLIVSSGRLQRNVPIFVFNGNLDKFQFLRNVFLNNEVLSIVTANIRNKSLIMLSVKRSPILVLKFNVNFNNFYPYQSISVDSDVISLSINYLHDTALMFAANENGYVYIYCYRHVEGWKVESQGKLLNTSTILTPFKLGQSTFILSSSTLDNTYLLKLIDQGI